MLTQSKVTSIYCIIDDLLKQSGRKDYPTCKMTDSEVITTALVSALYFGGHLDNARGYMCSSGNIAHMLDKSRFCRRLHKLGPLLDELFFQIGHCLKAIAGAAAYILDSFPVAVCDNIRISRSRIVTGERYRGYQASMHRYFYGIKVQVLTTSDGIPVEFCFVPGSEHDVKALDKLPMEVTAGSCIYADAAYTNYQIEDDLLDAAAIHLLVSRKSNSKRTDQPSIVYLKEQMRKGIETTFSSIKALFLRKIHAVSFQGFLIKIMLFLFAFTLNKLT
ncbi:MAG: IS982 family transposase [Sphingobacteriaceae bacterium]|nr:MAG: IS982 family transposase [Sphingobacteriaceae bacterium]